MIRLTNHTRRRMQERGIALSWIEATVTSPDKVEPDPDPALTRSFKAIVDFGGRILRVVHRQDGADILVLTAFFDRGARR